MNDPVSHDDFWSHIDDAREGMLAVGHSASVPMTHYSDRESNALYFITAKGTDTAQAATTPSKAQFIIASNKGNVWARIDGTATCVTDRQKLDEFWNAFSNAWFDGKDDPDVQLVRFDLSEAEVWITDGSAKFLYEVAKANLGGDKPDVGGHGRLSFAA